MRELSINASKMKGIYFRGDARMKKSVAYITILLMCTFAFNINIALANKPETISTSSVSLTPSLKDISGYHESEEGGAYYVRQIANNVYWFGEDPDGSYANVMKGTINGNQIIGRFWDVPKGRAKGSGEITLEIKSDALVKISPSGTKTFKKTFMRTEIVNGLPVITGQPPEARSRPAGFVGGENNLTAAWVGDDYAYYYVRELADGEVVWVAEHPFYGGQGGTAQPAFTHVFFGKKTGKVIKGEWIDVPKGKTSGNGTLELNITDPQV
jgi:hypothetical protein